MANIDRNAEPIGEETKKQPRRVFKPVGAAAGGAEQDEGGNTPHQNENGASEPTQRAGGGIGAQDEAVDAIRDDLAGDTAAEATLSATEEEELHEALKDSRNERMPISENNPFRGSTLAEIKAAIKGSYIEAPTEDQLKTIIQRCHWGIEAALGQGASNTEMEHIIKAAAVSMHVSKGVANKDAAKILRELRAAAEEAANAGGAPNEPWLRAMNRNYVLVNGEVMRFNRTAAEIAARGNRLEGMKKEAFKECFTNKRIERYDPDKERVVSMPLERAWRLHPGRLEYSRVDMCPKGSEPRGTLNLWEGFAVSPIKKDWKKTKEFLLEIICGGNQRDYDHMIKILAKWMRNPLACGEVGIILLSGQGTGKGTFAEMLADLFGRMHSLFTASQESLLGKHNDHLLGRLFVFLDEAMFGGDHRAGDKLKQMINAPRIEIEPKFQSRFSTPNRLHFVIASNSSKSVPINTDDRRWLVLDVSEDRKNDRAYFGDLRKAWAEGEREGFLYSLLDNSEIDLTNFDPRPHVNTAKEQLMDAVSTGPERFVKQMILDCGADILTDAQAAAWAKGDLDIPMGDIYDAYRSWCANTGHPDKYSNTAVIGKTISNMLGTVISNGRKKPFNVNRRQERVGEKRVWKYIFPKNSICVDRLIEAGITAKEWQ